VEARLDTIADEIERVGLRAPAIMIVGDVVALRHQLRWFEDRPLFGARVVVTRAAERSSTLVHALGALGADAVPLPCIEVVAPADPAAVPRALCELATPACDVAAVIVSSVPGVDALCDGLDAAGLDLRALAGRIVVAVGPTTAAHARTRGLRPDLVPEAARSEGLVETLRAAGLLSRRILHVRGDEARDVLATAVAEGGGHLDVVLGYRTVRPRVPGMLVHSLRPIADGGEGVDLVTLTSSKAARAWMDTVHEHLGDELAEQVLRATPTVCIGPVTAQAVSALGLPVAAVAPTPDDAGLLAAVRKALAR
jgi:uroporphyrinogen III methyltransferase/synthase